MENASEALKMVFSMLILVMALSFSISLISQVRETSDIMLEIVDRENGYDYVDYEVNNLQGKAVNNREVGVETIIPTLYRAYRENFKVIFLKENGQPFYLYTSNSITRKSKNPLDKNFNVIDLADEAGETWSSLISTCDDFLNQLISGVGNTYFDRKDLGSTEGLYKRLSNKKIIEYMGEYSDTELKSTTNDGIKKNEVIKRVITYVICN